MVSTITKAWNALVRFVRPDVDAIISAFLKAQTKLSDLIDREELKLEREASAIRQLAASQVTRNTTINRAYKIIHNLDGLTA